MTMDSVLMKVISVMAIYNDCRDNSDEDGCGIYVM